MNASGLIEWAVTAAHARGRWGGVCGAAAGDPHAVEVYQKYRKRGGSAVHLAPHRGPMASRHSWAERKLPPGQR